MGTMASKQRGVSLEGFLGVLAVVVFVVIGAVKIIPAYTDDATIKSKFTDVAHDPELKNASERDIRLAFIKRITVSNITAIKPDDIVVSRDAGGIVISASYSVKIPLFGNASLVLEFNPSSASR